MNIITNCPYRPQRLGLDDPENLCWGVFVGGCIDERNSWSVWEDGRQAHAHNSSTDPFMGWICFVRPEDVLTRGKPSKILLHEYAHLLVPNKGHPPAWKRAVTRLGAGSEIARNKLSPL